MSRLSPPRRRPGRGCRVYVQTKRCTWCDAKFEDFVFGDPEADAPWWGQEFCSLSCAKKAQDNLPRPRSPREMPEWLTPAPPPETDR